MYYYHPDPLRDMATAMALPGKGREAARTPHPRWSYRGDGEELGAYDTCTQHGIYLLS